MVEYRIIATFPEPSFDGEVPPCPDRHERAYTMRNAAPGGAKFQMNDRGAARTVRDGQGIVIGRSVQTCECGEPYLT